MREELTARSDLSIVKCTEGTGFPARLVGVVAA